MTRRPASAPAALLALALAVFAFPAAAQTIAPAPVPGPVGLSVGNESRMALYRAERWLAIHDSAPAPDEDPDALPPDDDAAPAGGDPAPLLPLLQGDRSVLPPDDNPYEALERLARALARRGEPYVFLPDGTPLPWRNAILHELVTAQRLDTRGAGWWTVRPDLSPDDPASDALPSTRAACRTLLFLSGVPSP